SRDHPHLHSFPTRRSSDLQSVAKTFGIDPSQVLAWHLAVGEVAEIAGGITGVCDRNITKGGAAVTDEAQHVPDFCSGRGHSEMRSEEHTSELQSQSNLVCR